MLQLCVCVTDSPFTFLFFSWIIDKAFLYCSVYAVPKLLPSFGTIFSHWLFSIRTM